MSKPKPSILFVWTHYPDFLKKFYKKHSKWQKFSYKKLTNLKDAELFGNSNFYSKNFKSLGWRAYDVVVNDSNQQSTWSKEYAPFNKKLIDKFLEKIPLSLKIRTGLVENNLYETLFAQIRYYKPDIVYFHHLGLFSPKQLKGIKKLCRLLVGQIASPLPKNENILKSFDLIVSSFPHFVKLFKAMGVKSEYLKWCAEHTVLDKIRKLPRVYDVTYIGSLSPHHSKGNKILETVARKTNINFWGYAENFLPLNSRIRKNFKGQSWGKEMYQIFAGSKIVINRHIDISGDYANNMRMFEATLMGAMLLTDKKKNLEEFFKINKEVVTYKDAEELVSKVNYYLKHNKEREMIALAGQRRTLKDHTFKVRMKELEKILLTHLKKKK